MDEIRDYVVTGTQVYGPAGKNSDIDIVLKAEDVAELERELRGKNVEVYRTEVQKRSEYSGFYFELGKMTINIICVVGEVYLSKWQYATERMRELPPFKDRAERLKAFKNFIEEVR